jgi:hypothetical protein
LFNNISEVVNNCPFCDVVIATFPPDPDWCEPLVTEENEAVVREPVLAVPIFNEAPLDIFNML